MKNPFSKPKPAERKKKVPSEPRITIGHIVLAMLLFLGLGGGLAKAFGQSADTLYIYQDCNGTGLQLVPSTMVRGFGLDTRQIVGVASNIEVSETVVNFTDDKGRRYYVSKENVTLTCR